MKWGHWFQAIIGYFLIDIASTFKGEDISLFQTLLYVLICSLWFKIDNLELRYQDE